MHLIWIAMSLAQSATDSAPVGGAKLTVDRGAVVRGPRDARRLALVFTTDLYAEGAGTILDALRDRRIKACSS
jgi:hypothetical protein